MELRQEKENDEEAPFLGPVTVSSQTRSKKSRWLFIVHAICFAANLILLAFSISLVRSSTSPVKAFNDLNIRYINKQYTTIRESPYIGTPSDSVDQAWHSLFAPMSLRVSPSELASHSLTSISLPGGGHLAWLGVFHELHCIKQLYQMNYRDHYHPNLTDAAMRDLQVHNDHCIDQLRNAIMCHGDVQSLTTFVWREGWEKPLLSPEREERRCFDWGMLVGSLQGRVVGEEEMGRVRNPLIDRIE